MKPIQSLVAVIALMTAIPSFAATQLEYQCGAYFTSETDGMRSDDGSANEMPVHRSDLRSITIRSSKGTTRIRSVQAYDANIRGWRDLTYQFRGENYCDGTFNKLCEDQEATVCIPRRWNVQYISVFTSGGDKAKYRIRLGFDR